MAPKKKKGGGKEDESIVWEPGDDKHAPETWISAVLQAHNAKRTAHWLAPLVWSEECYEHARMQANACQEEQRRMPKNFVESLSGRHGQNSIGPMKKEMKWDLDSAETVVQQWYSEKDKYDWNNPGPSKGASNFIQMMWAGTCSVGMALSPDGTYCVANYFPQVGNQLSYKYKTNILPPRKEQPPWVTLGGAEELPEIYKVSPCAESNWERHDEVTKLLEKGTAPKPVHYTPKDLPDLEF
eukprot:TRINITY_DN78389_c0_g1_i1.p1 TRINITY_DN78389_c0_g1~~TRINITY_DN78389_c0_g1_i1.p1  ORF type:complete len:264 (+),score=42.11 TRINITY_DN78389_c0_g1_i1:75-794(+)